MRVSRFAVNLLLLALLLAVGGGARAQLMFTLDTPNLSGAPGDTIAFNATLLNTSATDDLTLDGSSPALTGSGTLMDLFGNTLSTLTPGQSQQLVLFNVLIDASAMDGATIQGTYSIDFTPGIGTPDTTSPQTFFVQVAAPTSNVPEPSGALLLPVMGAGLYLLRARRNRITLQGTR